jgi:hypothetical protein
VATELDGSFDSKKVFSRNCVLASARGRMAMGYKLSCDEHISAAQMLGARMAREDSESPQDAAQDAALAYLEEVAIGTEIVRAGRIKYRMLAKPGDASHLRPLLSRSYSEGLDELPEWAL